MPADPVQSASQERPQPLRAALIGLLNALNVYERNWMTTSTGYGKVSEAKGHALDALDGAHHTEAFGPSPDTAHLASQERPQPDLRAALKAYDKQQITGPELADVVRASQERPPIGVEQIVRAALRIVDQTTPLSVGEPLVQRILSSLSPHNREADHE